MIPGPTISARHIELLRTDSGLRMRSIGRNKTRQRGVSIVEADLAPGDWIEAGQCWLQALSTDMLCELPAAEFFLGVDNHLDIGMLMFCAGRRYPVELIGPGGEEFARRIHRMASRPADGFLVVDKNISGLDLRVFMNRHKGVTAYVDLNKADKLDIPSIEQLARIKGAPIQFVFGSAKKNLVERWLPGLMAAHVTAGTKAHYQLVDLKNCEVNRRVLARLVLDVHGLKSKLDELVPDQFDRVLNHAAIRTLDDLWRAPLRLAALLVTAGSVKPAADLMTRWGCPEARTTLDDWVVRLDIDMRKLCRSY